MSLSALTAAAGLPLRAFPWSRPRPRLVELRQLVCRSRAARPLGDTELEALLLNLHERQNRHGGGVGGALLHHNDAFLVCLEGPEQAVIEAYARLGRDAHHHSLEEVLYRPTAARAFPRWMAASTAARRGGWLDACTMEWEFGRRHPQRLAPSPVGGLLNRAWEVFRQSKRLAGEGTRLVAPAVYGAPRF